MFVSMLALSFLVLAIAWKSFEQNLGVRLGGIAPENNETAPGPLQSLTEDIKRIAKGEEPLLPETSDMRQETSSGWIERIFEMARETKRVIKYNTGEMLKLFAEIRPWLAEVLW